jgi:hypothetical protein
VIVWSMNAKPANLTVDVSGGTGGLAGGANAGAGGNGGAGWAPWIRVDQ